MTSDDAILGAALACSAIVGLIVYAADRRRTPNQAFVAIALTVAAWLGSILTVFHCTAPIKAAMGIRAATLIGGFIPVAITLLRVAIARPMVSLARVVRRIRGWFVAYGLIVIYTLSPLYLVGAQIPKHGVPNAVYGSLSWVFPLYLLCGLAWAIVLVIKERREAHGIIAVELDYLLAGIGCIVGAVIFAGVMPLILHNSQIVQFAPLWFVAMNVVIAYGIATRRILSVGTLLRRALSYILLAAYLGGVYAVAWWGMERLLQSFSLNPSTIAPLTGTLCVVFSIGSAQNFFQLFVRKLFISLHHLDLRSTLKEADPLLTQVTTTAELLDNFLPLLARAAGTEMATVCLFEPGISQMVWSIPKGTSISDPTQFDVFRDLPSPLVAATFLRDEGAVRDGDAAEKLKALGGGLAVPIKGGPGDTGVVILGEKLSGKIFDGEEQEAIQIIVNRFASALLNARLYTEQRKSKEYLQSLLEDLPGAVVACDPAGVITVCNVEASRLLEIPAESLLERPMERLPQILATALHDVMAGRGDPRDRTDTLEIGGRAIPIRFSTRAFADPAQGAFIVFRDLTRIKTLEEQQLLRNAHDRAIARLSQRGLEGRNLGRLIQEAVRTVAQVLNLEFCEVLQVLPDGGGFLSHAGIGWTDTGSIITGDNGTTCEFALRSGAAVVIEELKSETRFQPSMRLLRHGVRSGVLVPIHGRARPYGILSAHTAKSRNFSSDEVRFLQSVASTLALTIVRTELENEMLDIIGREQRSLGQDLHDSLCQELVGIQFKTGAFAKKIADEKLKDEAKQICDYMAAALNHARMLAKGLVPVHVETNGLMSALDELATNMSILFNFPCRFECPLPVMVADLAVSTHLYRIAQEAISNAIRHGGASHVLVRLERHEGKDLLTIRDDGIGFSPAPVNRNGMGLHTMAYRADAIGAKLAIDGSTGQGTTVSCAFPSELGVELEKSDAA